MAQDPGVKELIRNWLTYVQKNNISDPDPQDLRHFLHAADFESPAIEQALQAARTLDPDKLIDNPDSTDQTQPDAIKPEGPSGSEAPRKPWINVNDPEDEQPDDTGDATVPSDLEQQGGKKHEPDFGTEPLHTAFTSFDDMTDQERSLYKDFVGVIKAMRGNERQLLAQEIKRFSDT